MLKYIIVVFSSLMFGCANDRTAHLEERVGNLELEDKRTRKDNETMVLNQVDIQQSIIELNDRLDKVLSKNKKN